MKKFLSIITGIFIGLASFFTPFMSNSNFVCGSMSSTASAVEIKDVVDNDESLKSILQSISITQPEYALTSKNFLKRTIVYDGEEQKDVYCLYVNTAITFTAIKTTNIYITSTTPNSSKSEQLNAEGSHFTIEFDGEQECTRKVYIQKNEDVSTRYSLTFYLVQTPVSFKLNQPYSWTNHTGSDVFSPELSYQTINLSIDDSVATQNSPIFIDFYFNGEFYSLYKKGDTIYNQLTDNPLEKDIVTFNLPGQYSIYIYDLTCTRAIEQKSITIPGTQETKNIVSFSLSDISLFEYANVKSYSFSISDLGLNGGNIYLIARTSTTKSSVINSQIVNVPVRLDFYNLAATYVSEIIVEKSHTEISGSTKTEPEILYSSKSDAAPNVNSDIEKLKDRNNPIIYSEDNIYTIKIYNSDSQVLYSFKFTILTGIHSSYGDISSVDQEPNITKEFTQTKTISHSYSSIKEMVDGSPQELQSYTINKYKVNIARANCSIDGVVDGSSTKDNVTITVHGVGTITTIIYRDGVFLKKEYLSNGASYTLTDPGKYKIQTTDALNTTIYKTFTITQEISASTIILICVGVVGLLVFLILVTRARTKIKVR